jgi:hypothetical protein
MQPNAVVTTVTAASQAAMLALTAQTDDFCVRTDVKKTFVLTGTDPTNLAHWQEVYTIDQANVAITGGSISGVTMAATPATKSPTDVGTPGQICWDANYIYVCTATDTWKKAALT